MPWVAWSDLNVNRISQKTHLDEIQNNIQFLYDNAAFCQVHDGGYQSGHDSGRDGWQFSQDYNDLCDGDHASNYYYGPCKGHHTGNRDWDGGSSSGNSGCRYRNGYYLNDD